MSQKPWLLPLDKHFRKFVFEKRGTSKGRVFFIWVTL